MGRVTRRTWMLDAARRMLGRDVVVTFARERYPDHPRPQTRMTTQDVRDLFRVAVGEKCQP